MSFPSFFSPGRLRLAPSLLVPHGQSGRGRGGGGGCAAATAAGDVAAAQGVRKPREFWLVVWNIWIIPNNMWYIGLLGIIIPTEHL